MNQKKPQKKAKRERIARLIFFPGHAMKSKINFQLHFNLPAYIANGKT